MGFCVSFRLLIVSIAVFCMSSLADDVTIKVDDWAREQLPSVQDDADNITVFDRVESKSEKVELPKKLKKNFKSVRFPELCLASKIENRQKRIVWQPKWYYFHLGGPRLPSTALSSDSSVLAIAETTGTQNGPFGSRIIFFNTYSWKIIRCISFGNKKIVRMMFMPNSATLLCWFDKQVRLKQTYTLALLDCTSGTIIHENSELKSALNDFSCSADGQVIYVAVREQHSIFCFSGVDLKLQPKRFKFNGIPIKVACNFDNSRLAVSNNKSLSIFNVLNPDMVENVPLKTYRAGKQLFYVNQQSLISVADSGRVLLYQNGRIREIEKFAGMLHFLCKEEQVFGLLKLRKNELQIFSSADCAYKYSAFPVLLKPRTRFPLSYMNYLPQYKAFICLDSGGNLYMVYKPRKRWRKYLIITAKK